MLTGILVFLTDHAHTKEPCAEGESGVVSLCFVHLTSALFQRLRGYAEGEVDIRLYTPGMKRGIEHAIFQRAAIEYGV